MAYVERWERNVLGDVGSAPDWLAKQARSYVAHPGWFDPEDSEALAQPLGRISKLQSLRSEDAVTWSWFGTLAACDGERRAATLAWLLEEVGVAWPVSTAVQMRQWERVPHPNEPGRPGPEIDAIADDPGGPLVFVEAKWDAPLGTGKGAAVGVRDDQVLLRQAALASTTQDGRRCLVLMVARAAMTTASYAPLPAVVATTWQQLARCECHPHADEFREYLAWKERWAGADRRRS